MALSEGIDSNSIEEIIERMRAAVHAAIELAKARIAMDKQFARAPRWRQQLRVRRAALKRRHGCGDLRCSPAAAPTAFADGRRFAAPRRPGRRRGLTDGNREEHVMAGHVAACTAPPPSTTRTSKVTIEQDTIAGEAAADAVIDAAAPNVHLQASSACDTTSKVGYNSILAAPAPTTGVAVAGNIYTCTLTNCSTKCASRVVDAMALGVVTALSKDVKLNPSLVDTTSRGIRVVPSGNNIGMPIMSSMDGFHVDFSDGASTAELLLFGNIFKNVPELAESPCAGTALHIFDSVRASAIGVLGALLMKCILRQPWPPPILLKNMGAGTKMWPIPWRSVDMGDCLDAYWEFWLSVKFPSKPPTCEVFNYVAIVQMDGYMCYVKLSVMWLSKASRVPKDVTTLLPHVTCMHIILWRARLVVQSALAYLELMVKRQDDISEGMVLNLYQEKLPHDIVVFCPVHIVTEDLTFDPGIMLRFVPVGLPFSCRTEDFNTILHIVNRLWMTAMTLRSCNSSNVAVPVFIQDMIQQDKEAVQVFCALPLARDHDHTIFLLVAELKFWRKKGQRMGFQQWLWKPTWLYLPWQIIGWKSIIVVIQFLGGMIGRSMSGGCDDFLLRCGLISEAGYIYMHGHPYVATQLNRNASFFGLGPCLHFISGEVGDSPVYVPSALMKQRMQAQSTRKFFLSAAAKGSIPLQGNYSSAHEFSSVWKPP